MSVFTFFMFYEAISGEAAGKPILRVKSDGTDEGNKYNLEPL